MTDTFSPEERSRIMSRVHSKNTRPERLVRSILHSMGYRFRLHYKSLPGCPDIVLPRHKKVIFVHGCFWHAHPECKRATRPTTRPDFWAKKIDGNVRRDAIAQKTLTELGWQVLIVWQCETMHLDRLRETLRQYMGG